MSSCNKEIKSWYQSSYATLETYMKNGCNEIVSPLPAVTKPQIFTVSKPHPMPSQTVIIKPPSDSSYQQMRYL